MATRREVLGWTAAGLGVLATGATRAAAVETASKPLDILFLGGTGFIGPFQVEHAERIALTQVLLAKERKSLQVFEMAQVAWMHARGVERAAVVGYILISVSERPTQPLQL